MIYIGRCQKDVEKFPVEVQEVVLPRLTGPNWANGTLPRHGSFGVTHFRNALGRKATEKGAPRQTRRNRVSLGEIATKIAIRPEAVYGLRYVHGYAPRSAG